MTRELRIRSARPADGPAVADLWLRSRLAAIPAIPPPVHAPREIAAFFATSVAAGGWEVAEYDGEMVAVLLVEGSEIEHLYVAPGHTGHGVGSELVERAKRASHGVLRLWTFAANRGARRFYECHGFQPTSCTDGVNEEATADVRYQWSSNSARPTPEMDVDALGALVDAPALPATAVTLHGGIAGEMTLVSWGEPAAPRFRIVVRRFPRDETPERLIREFRVAERAHRAGVPCAEPLLLDAEGATLGSPLGLWAYVDGTPRVASVDPVRSGVRYAELLAAIHDVAPPPEVFDRHSEIDQLLRDPPATFDATTDEAAVRSELGRLATWPVLDEAEVVLLHGDLWPGNVLWNLDVVAGVVDWEDSAEGDPAADLAVTRLDLLWTYGPEAMRACTDEYVALTGRSLGSLPYWDLVAALRPAGNLDEWTSVWPALGRPDLTAAVQAGVLRDFVADALARVPPDV